MSIKKKALLGLSLPILIILLSSTYYMRPQQYNESVTGIRYQLRNTSFEEKVQIEIDGLYSKKIFGGFNFNGYIYIDNIKFETSISNKGRGILNSNGKLSKQTDRGNINGTVFVNDSLDEFSIIFDGWNTGDGVIIAVPAKSRKDAINLSNELMKEVLNKFDIRGFI